MAKIHEEMSELLDKQVNVQKESLKKLLGFMQPPASPRSVIKMNEEKKDCRVNFFTKGRAL